MIEIRDIVRSVPVTRPQASERTKRRKKQQDESNRDSRQGSQHKDKDSGTHIPDHVDEYC
jgi:hypothetical protein